MRERVIRDNLKEEMEGVMKETQCGRCHKKAWVLISYSTLYDTDICKTCHLKLKVRHKDKEDLSGQRSQLSFNQGFSRSIRRSLSDSEKRKQGIG